MSRKPETQFRQGRVVPFLKTLQHTKHTPIQQAAFNGDPDLVLCIRGQYFDLELKDDGEKPDPLQEFKMSETRRCGGQTIVAYPSTWVKVKLLLSKLDKGEIE